MRPPVSPCLISIPQGGHLHSGASHSALLVSQEGGHHGLSLTTTHTRPPSPSCLFSIPQGGAPAQRLFTSALVVSQGGGHLGFTKYPATIFCFYQVYSADPKADASSNQCVRLSTQLRVSQFVGSFFPKTYSTHTAFTFYAQWRRSLRPSIPLSISRGSGKAG